MPTYATIDGVQKELSVLPAMVDGVQKELSFLNATVDGVAREIFSAVKGFVWNKYSVKSVFNQASSSATVTSFTIADTVYVYNDNYLESGTRRALANSLVVGDYFQKSSSSNIYQCTSVSDVYRYGKPVTYTTGKGDFIENVTDEDATAYPTDGIHTDGYWYVLEESFETGEVLEYIESSGSECLDTEYAPNQDTKLVIDFYFLESNTGTDHHIASINEFGGPYYAFRTKSDLSCWYTRYGTDALTIVAASSIYGRHTLVRNQNKTSLDGGTETVSTYSTFQISDTIPLCCYKAADTGALSGFAAIRIYSCKIYDAGILVRDYVPYRRANGEVGLWDKVGSKFYGNVGSGAFTGALAA